MQVSSFRGRSLKQNHILFLMVSKFPMRYVLHLHMHFISHCTFHKTAALSQHKFNVSSLSMSYNYIALIRSRALKTRHINFNSDVSSAYL
jgi:hypothetical protein